MSGWMMDGYMEFDKDKHKYRYEYKYIPIAYIYILQCYISIRNS